MVIKDYNYHIILYFFYINSYRINLWNVKIFNKKVVL